MSPKLNLIGILLVAAVVGTPPTAVGGVRLGADSAFYISAGNDLLAGGGLTGNEVDYSGYIAFLAVLELLGLGLGAVLVVQVCVAVIAGLALRYLARAVVGPVAATLLAGIFLANPEIGKWHAYVLTDSLFISLVPIVAFAVHRAHEKGGRWMAAAAIALLVAAAIRPTGWFLLMAAALFFIWLRLPRIVLRTAAALAIVSLAALAIALSPLGARLTAADPRPQDFAGRRDPRLRTKLVADAARPRHIRNRDLICCAIRA